MPTPAPLRPAPPRPAPSPCRPPSPRLAPRLAIGPEQLHTRLENSGYVPTDTAGILEIPGAVVIGGPLAVVALDPARGKIGWRRVFSSGGEGGWRSHASPGGRTRFATLRTNAHTIFATDADLAVALAAGPTGRGADVEGGSGGAGGRTQAHPLLGGGTVLNADELVDTPAAASWWP